MVLPLMHRAWFTCGGCGTPFVLPLVRDNLYDGFDPANTYSLTTHFLSHYASMVRAETQHRRALDAWENEGGA